MDNRATKSFLSQILIGPFLNTLTQMKLNFQGHNTLSKPSFTNSLYDTRLYYFVLCEVPLIKRGRRIWHDWGDGKNLLQIGLNKKWGN